MVLHKRFPFLDSTQRSTLWPIYHPGLGFGTEVLEPQARRVEMLGRNRRPSAAVPGHTAGHTAGTSSVAGSSTTRVAKSSDSNAFGSISHSTLASAAATPQQKIVQVLVGRIKSKVSFHWRCFLRIMAAQLSGMSGRRNLCVKDTLEAPQRKKGTRRPCLSRSFHCIRNLMVFPASVPLGHEPG
jgi:hypothetical protein